MPHQAPILTPVRENRPHRSERVFFVAGEMSGDGLGADLVQELLRLAPGMTAYAIGGPEMQQAGAEVVDNIIAEACIGFSHVPRRILYWCRRFVSTIGHVKRCEPHVVVLIACPGFNLPVARALARFNARPPVVYYCPPEVCEHGGEPRARKVAALVDHLICHMEHEKDLFAKFTDHAYYFGHPLAQRIEAVRGGWGTSVVTGPGNSTTGLESFRIGVFPGSRKYEIRTHLPVLVQAARLVERKSKTPIEWNVVLARDELLALAESVLCRSDLKHFTVTRRSEMKDDAWYRFLSRLNLALAKMGMITLELGLLQVPMVTFYRIRRLDLFIYRKQILTSRFSLPNIILRQDVVPELVQQDLTPQRIARDVLDLMVHPQRLEAMITSLGELRKQFEGRTPVTESAQLIVRLARECLPEGAVAASGTSRPAARIG